MVPDNDGSSRRNSSPTPRRTAGGGGGGGIGGGLGGMLPMLLGFLDQEAQVAHRGAHRCGHLVVHRGQEQRRWRHDQPARGAQHGCQLRPQVVRPGRGVRAFGGQREEPAAGAGVLGAVLPSPPQPRAAGQLRSLGQCLRRAHHRAGQGHWSRPQEHGLQPSLHVQPDQDRQQRLPGFVHLPRHGADEQERRAPFQQVQLHRPELQQVAQRTGRATGPALPHQGVPAPHPGGR
jgi:hypothetical protein